MKYKNVKCFAILAVFLLFSLLAAPAWVFAGESESAAEPNSVSASVAGNPASLFEQVCSNIYKGDFAAARELLGGSKESESTAISRLTNIISEYEKIEQSRQAAKKAAYKERLAELEKFAAAAEANDVNADANDVNDVNDIPKVLAVIAKACEFADEAQKRQILSKQFVKQTIQKAIDKAAEFESKGKWLDAYTNCYWWLAERIEPDNEAYADYAEQLMEKANIVASFQDSPCETSKERFKNVKKKMFIRAIGALNFNYVNIIDYRQMATKAIRRCELLAEVMNRDLSDERRATSQELAAWTAGLAAILDEVNQSAAGFSKDKFIEVFEKILALNSSLVASRSSLESRGTSHESRETLLPGPVLIAQFAEAALSALDRYTVMVWPRQVQDFEKIMTNEFTGIGIVISKQKGMLTVASLLPDTPAYNSGLDAGDVIEAVDAVETKDMSLVCAVRSITGPAGTKVTLTVKRTGEELVRDITITRAKITVPTILGWARNEAGKWLYMIDEANEIGYVRLTSFSERTASDLEKVLNRLEAEGLSKGGLILDLRFNSGGLLNSAIEVTDKFVKEGLIVSTRPRFGVWTYAPAQKEKTHPDYPIVVLINSGSASASEIVAGALADPQHKRAILVGERTHGKGSVQGITQYPGDGAQLKYTMAYYHLPSGQRVESRDVMEKQGRSDWGVGPNIEIKLRSDELGKMIDVQRDNDVLVRADHDNGAAPLKKHTAEETIATDPQLAVGILVIKSKLIEEKTKSRM